MQILSQTEVWRWPQICVTGAFISGLILFGAILVMLIEHYYKGECSKGSMLTMVFSLSVLIIMLGAGFSNNMPYCNDYKVTLDDTVSAKEFLNQYELLRIDDEIYEIREYINE